MPDRIDHSMRIALWRANKEQCFYCTQPIAWRDLEIDHIVPKSLGEEEWQQFQKTLTLDPDFARESPLNWVPTHHDCNRRKAAKTLPSLPYYLDLWRDRQSQVQDELSRLMQEAEGEHVLSTLLSPV